MARTPLGQLILTIEEFEWIGSMLSRKVFHIGQSEDKRLNAVILGLVKKVEGLQLPARVEQQIILNSNRNELRYVQAVAQNTHDAMAGNVMQEFHRRIELNNEHKAYYEQKKNEAQQTVTLLAGLLTKIDGVL